MRDKIEAVRALTACLITDSMARAESWAVHQRVYQRARDRGLPPEQAYEEAAEAQRRAYAAIMSRPIAANDVFPPDSPLNADLAILEQALNRRL